jgi:hypothetical protein
MDTLSPELKGILDTITGLNYKFLWAANKGTPGTSFHRHNAQSK